MNKEIIKQIRQEYNDFDKISKGNLQEIKELEQNPIVQRYRYLLNIKDSIERIDDCYKQAYIVGEIIDKYGSGLIEPTNNLWFWFLDCSVSQYERMFKTVSEKTDKDKIVCIYLDLENSKKVIAIPIEEQDNFETMNKVIRGNRTIFDAQDRYFNTRYKYFNLCINEGQETAIKTMLCEEKCRQEETKKAKDEELKELSDCLNYNLITREEYVKRRQLILSKK